MKKGGGGDGRHINTIVQGLRQGLGMRTEALRYKYAGTLAVTTCTINSFYSNNNAAEITHAIPTVHHDCKLKSPPT